MNRLARLAALTLSFALIAGCGHEPPHTTAAPAHGAHPRTVAMPSVADSITVGLWRFDERGGTHATDASPFRLYGTAGPDVRTEFGRYKSARGFTATSQSFVWVPYNPVMESPRRFTIEAWLYLNDLSRHELSMIAGRWTPVPNQQSWFLGVVGRRIVEVQNPSPGWFNAEVALAGTGRLVFGFRPDLAAGTQNLTSSVTLPLQRWVHVAATLDGEVVRLYVDGRLDVQMAVASGIRRSDAPFVVGNVFDPRLLTDFGSELRLSAGNLPLPYYALNGIVDELRLSNGARTTFESADLR
jgi:Concanavalin A-like lectin/glucanases superfamily